MDVSQKSAQAPKWIILPEDWLPRTAPRVLAPVVEYKSVWGRHGFDGSCRGPKACRGPPARNLVETRNANNNWALAASLLKRPLPLASLTGPVRGVTQ